MVSHDTKGLARINCRSRFLRGLDHAAPGAPLDRILRESAIDLEGLYETGLTAQEYARLLHTAAEITGNPLLPLRIGLEAEIGEFGIYGYSLLSCRDPNQMARIAVDYQPLAGYGFRINVADVNNRLHLDVGENGALDARANLLLVLEFLGANHAIMRARFAPDIELPVIGADLAHASPGYHRKLAAALPFPLRFDRANTAIYLNRDILSTAVDPQGAELNVRFLQRCEAELARLASTGSTDIASQTRSLIYQALLTDVPSQRDIATLLHLSPRTMNRRLSEQGSSFSRLLTECRMSLARRLLMEESLSVQEVSFRLGYAQPNSFYRAYRKYFGLSPRADQGR